MKLPLLSLVMLSLSVYGQGAFAPPAGQAGTTAIHKDSSAIMAWATYCEVERGWMDVSDTTAGRASFGVPADALGPSDPAIVSLGDNGSAVLSFNGTIYDGPGPDFAVFENAFDDVFLELAFVEVSSDGINFFRFPATSTTPDTSQIGAFGEVDATHLNNLAGKYRAQYGTPFDLSELSGTPGLDVNSVTHIRIVDCVGAIDTTFATFDQFSNPINDPFPTPFSSSGFDLEAVGVINFVPLTGITEYQLELKVYPNPASEVIHIAADAEEYGIYNFQGQLLRSSQTPDINIEGLPAGSYLVEMITDEGRRNITRFVKR